jgi:CHAT domain-containing protein
MRVTSVIAALLVLAVPLLGADKPDALTGERRIKLLLKTLELNQECERLCAAGHFVKAKEMYREVLETVRNLFPKKDYPKGDALLAKSINNMAYLHHETGEYDKAESLYREALEMYRALYPRKDYPEGHPDLALTLNNLAILHRDAGEYSKAETLFRESLEMRRALFPKKSYPNGHPDIANTISHLAELYHAAGEYGKAEPLHKEALAMSRALFPKEDYPDGHPGLAADINNLGMLHKDAGEYAKAEPLLKEALAMDRALYPKEEFPRGHPHLAAGISNLALLFMQTGEYGKAEPLFKEALAMSRALYPKKDFPNGHINLAIVINNLAELHRAGKEYDKAEPLYKEALAMRRALFPKNQFPQGHPFLASSIDNLAALYMEAGEYGKAQPLVKEALAMRRALFPRAQYPQGHPLLAQSIHNLGVLYQEERDYRQAESLLKEALDMNRALFPKKLYPQGHPNLTYSIDDLAGLHIVAGEYGKAEPLLRESLDMNRSLALRYADLAAEAEALNYFASQHPTLIRDVLLSVSRHRPGSTVYDALWDSRAALTRLQQRRHRDLTASRDKDTADLADQLRRTRNSLAGLLLKPGRDPEAHRAAVQKLTDEKEDLEKRIVARLRLVPLPPATAATPQKLAERLPDGTAFVDLYRYINYEQDPRVKGKKGERRTPRYVAFVLWPGKAAVRVELEEAAPIEDAWAAWRQAITADRPDDQAERAAAARFAELVWKPIRAALPADLKTVYLVPDGPLHQVPWGALPGRKPDTVLLDEHAVCLVPHGPFLLERLQEKRETQPGDALLAYGGVDYDNDPAAVVKHDDVRGPLLREKRLKWGNLPGTLKEQQQVVALARKVLKADPISRSGRNANTRQLEEDLPRARYAHLATHGFFADPEFRSALQVDPKEFESGGGGERRGGARSPLVLSGLVLAGANRTGKKMAEDRGILTAEGLIGLRLEGLELAVLSACETGLGEYGGGEGVYGLQRAFHVAGCRSVIASLWKVDDGATQALMALFYRNLWERKLDAVEALRQAQLTLYRHPEAAEVAKKRGVDFTESDLPQVEDRPAAGPKRSPTAHWAAFTFSGVRPAEAKPVPGR